MGKMTLTSPQFEDMGFIPKKYTCKGEEIHPPLEISHVPRKAKSLVLIMEDPDTPFILPTITHWIVCHLEPKTKAIEEGKLPDKTLVGKNSFRQNKYLGPCPPWGTHRYIFSLYALDEKLPFSTKSGKKAILKAIQGHIIEKAELIGLFGKEKHKS